MSWISPSRSVKRFEVILFAAVLLLSLKETATAAESGVNLSGVPNGMISVHTDGDRILWTLPDTLSSREMGLFVTLLDAPLQTDRENKYGYRGDRYGPMILRFVRSGQDVHLESAVGHWLADDDADFASLHNEREGWSIVRDFPVVGNEAERGRFTIDVTEWLGDSRFFGLDPVSFLFRLVGVESRSCLSEIRTLKDQVIVRSEITCMPSPFPIPGARRDTTRWKVGTTRALLPVEPRRPRYDDPHVGFYSIPAVRADSGGTTALPARVIKRWRLEVAPEDSARYLRGEAVEPVRPIRFRLDTAFPERWKVPMIRAVHNWLPVFEACGFRNALEIRDAENDPDCTLDNVRYTWICYKESPMENAYGSPLADLRSGEIISAHISVFSSVFNLLQEWYISQTGNTNPIPDDMTEALFELVLTHEIGHVLGLEHNYYGSSLYDTAQLRDAESMRCTGAGTSIMDYMRLNYAAQPEDGFAPADLVPHIGAYDYAAIDWAYHEYPGLDFRMECDSVSRKARAMASRRETRFMTLSNVDPQAQREDIGREPLESALLGMNHLKRVCERIAAPNAAGTDTERLQRAVATQLRYYTEHAMTYVGGIRHDFDGSMPSVRAIGADEQRRALEFLRCYVVEPPAWLADALPRRNGTRIAERMTERLPFVHAAELRGGSDYSVEAYLDDMQRIFLGDTTDSCPSPERRKLIDGYTGALVRRMHDDDPGTVGIRIAVRLRLEALYHAVAEYDDEYWVRWRERMNEMLGIKNGTK